MAHSSTSQPKTRYTGERCKHLRPYGKGQEHRADRRSARFEIEEALAEANGHSGEDNDPNTELDYLSDLNYPTKEEDLDLDKWFVHEMTDAEERELDMEYFEKKAYSPFQDPPEYHDSFV